MLVREIVEARGWEDGKGWIYNQVISDLVFELDLEDYTEDWSWLMVEVDPDKRSDCKYTAKYYSADDEELQNVLHECSVWESELCK